MNDEVAIVEDCEIKVDQQTFTPYIHIALRLPLVRDVDIEDGVALDQDTQAMLLGRAVMEQSKMMLALTREHPSLEY